VAVRPDLAVVTVDTEEDSWGHVRGSHYAVENIGALPDFQKLCDELGVKPTYLVTYPVVTDATAAAILRTLLEDGILLSASRASEVKVALRPIVA
jgi:hypothetical protein